VIERIARREHFSPALTARIILEEYLKVCYRIYRSFEQSLAEDRGVSGGVNHR
jgi:hypothetical protein